MTAKKKKKKQLSLTNGGSLGIKQGEISLSPFPPLTLTVFIFNQSKQLIGTLRGIYMQIHIPNIQCLVNYRHNERGVNSIQLICGHKIRLKAYNIKYNIQEQMMFALVGIRRQRGKVGG